MDRFLPPSTTPYYMSHVHHHQKACCFLHATFELSNHITTHKLKSSLWRFRDHGLFWRLTHPLILSCNKLPNDWIISRTSHSLANFISKWACSGPCHKETNQRFVIPPNVRIRAKLLVEVGMFNVHEKGASLVGSSTWHIFHNQASSASNSVFGADYNTAPNGTAM